MHPVQILKAANIAVEMPGFFRSEQEDPNERVESPRIHTPGILAQHSRFWERLTQSFGYELCLDGSCGGGPRACHELTAVTDSARNRHPEDRS